tara:strand:- start:32562 stop:33017 length:456 start_codon:yes stop_codon:yes gene_type:complete
MINETIATRITKFSPKVKKNTSIQVLTLEFVSYEAIQDFFDTWDKEFGKNLRHPFTSNEIYWSSITYDTDVPPVNIKFDAIEFRAVDLVNVKVKVKDTKEGEAFVYSLTFHAKLDGDTYKTVAQYYLNHTEPNEETGKDEYKYYETLITKM